MNLYAHGADIFTESIDAGVDENNIIDFSSNINPLGFPHNVEKAIKDSIKNINRYPDTNMRRLRKKISEFEGVTDDFVFCSNGAAEAIFRIVLATKPKKALLTAPTFGEYEQALCTVDCEVEYYSLFEQNNFVIEDDILERIDSQFDIVFICNPNNPTGQITHYDLLRKIIQRCKDNNVFIVLDESFIDFIEHKNDFSTISLVEKYNNLTILKSFTKMYAIPGLRLGYCITSNLELIDKIKISGPPWNISNIAEAVGIECLKEVNFVENSIKYIQKQKEFLLSELKKLEIKVFDSTTNYLLLKVNLNIDLKTELIKRNILVRSCSNYRNLDKSYYRIAIKTEKENKILIENLKEIIGNRWRQHS